MCSYQNISDANFGSFIKENWEEDLWENVSSPSSNNSNSSIRYLQVQNAAVCIQSNPGESTDQDFQVEIPNPYQNVESSSMLSPAWDSPVPEAPQTLTNMSTYFATFDPTSQFQDVPVKQSPANNKSMVQNTAGNKQLHQARIHLVPAANGNFKAIVKRKRKRTIFTTEQLQVLEQVYSKKPYITRDERQVLVEQLQVNDKSVKIWFQNRRLKNKRVDHEIQDQCSIFERIDIIESKINEKADKFGFVTLDDHIMSDIVHVIDDYFASNVSPEEYKTENSPIYEPISPASNSDNSCEDSGISTWQHYVPNDIVQDLIDVESIITM